MFRFDVTLVQPTPETLEQTLREAAAVADAPGRGQLLRWPLVQFNAFRAKFRASPEGWWQWNGGEADTPLPPRERTSPQRTRGRGHAREPRPAASPRYTRPRNLRHLQGRSVVAVVWWSDYIGRRHVRVIGCQRRGAVEPPECLLKPSADEPAVARVYPNHVFYHTREERTLALVACSCGVIGSPEEVGWMGDRCGPCHDRHEAGESHTDHPSRILAHSQANAYCLTFSADGSVLAASGHGGWMRAWDTRTGRLVLTAQMDRGWCSRLRVSPDGTSVAGRVRDLGAIVCWDVASGTRRLLEVDAEVSLFEYLPDGRLLVVAAGEVQAWQPKTGRVEVLHHLDGYPVSGATLMLDDSLLAVELHGGEGAMRDVLGRTEDLKLRFPRTGLPPAVEQAARFGLLPGDLAGPIVAVSPDGHTFAVQVGSPYVSACIVLWDAARDQVRAPATCLWLTEAAFTPDGRTLVALDLARQWKSVRSWDVATGAERVVLRDCGKGFTSLALSPCGTRFATGDVEGRVKLWPAELLGG